jgi:hypothetical protein
VVFEMNSNLNALLEPCFRRTTGALRWMGLIFTAFFGIVFLAALYSVLVAPKIDGAMMVGLGIVAAFTAGGYAVYAHADRVQKQLHHVFFVAPEQVVKIDAKVFQNGPLLSYMIHFYSPKPAKRIGISVPNKAIFDQLRSLLPAHFPNANRT